MKAYDAPGIRNLAVVGHGGCGKTSLVSALLFDMGVGNRLGSVDDGTAPTDFDADEIERKISLQLGLAWGEWRKAKLNLLDAPGYANFVSEALSALRVADAALVVVDAVSGVEVHTDRMWQCAAQNALPRLVAVNRMDRERASFERTLESLRAAFGREVVPLAIPIGEEAAFKGIVDLVGEKARIYKDDRSGSFDEAEVPPELQERVAALRGELVEMVAEGDEALMEEFFEKGTLPSDDLLRGLTEAVRAGRLFPVFPTSALNNVGGHAILDAVLDYTPSPADRGSVRARAADGADIEVAPDAAAPLAAFVFKTFADVHAGHISLFRVYRGTLKPDTPVHNATREHAERIGGLMLLEGKQQTAVQELRAGDIGAAAKLKETRTGDTLCEKETPLAFVQVAFPEPTTTFAIEPKSRGDEDKISTALQKLMEEDPVLRLSRDAQTHEMLLSGMGQLHIEVLVAKLKHRYKVEVNLHKPKVPYRETIKAAAEGHGRHKKQTGGHGQFGDCRIRMRPLARGEDFQFVDKIFGGSIPKNYIPAVEKGIREARQKGCIAGYPMVDFEVELYDGQYHDVDSSEMSFKIAGSLAFKDAVQHCKPTLLEPIMKVEIAVPEEYAGSVMGDLASRRGRPQGMEPQGALQLIRAEVPMAEMLSYDADLTSMTGGRGSYHMEMSHYDEVPAHMIEKIVAAAKAAGGDEEVQE